MKPGLDPFDPKNGYNPNGSSTYSASFKAKYFAAQSERMNRLIAYALRKQEEIEAGYIVLPDDDDFTIARGGGGGGGGSAALRGLDLSIDCCTTKPAKLLKNDGTIATQIVLVCGSLIPGLAESNATFAGSKDLTVHGLSIAKSRTIN